MGRQTDKKTDLIDLTDLVLYLIQSLLQLGDFLAVLGDEVEVVVLGQLVHTLATLLNLYLCLLLPFRELSLSTTLRIFKNLKR